MCVMCPMSQLFIQKQHRFAALAATVALKRLTDQQTLPSGAASRRRLPDDILNQQLKPRIPQSNTAGGNFPPAPVEEVRIQPEHRGVGGVRNETTLSDPVTLIPGAHLTPPDKQTGSNTAETEEGDSPMLGCFSKRQIRASRSNF